MLFKNFPVGPLQCNCSILACEETGEALIIDPGDEAEKILAELAAHRLKPKWIVHTHAHFDHVGATRAVQEKTRAEVCLHRGDLFLFENVPMQATLFGLKAESAGSVQHFINDKDVLSFGNHKIEVLHTPGHTPGSVTFYLSLKEGPLLFTGDTLFLQGIGRTDLWGGDFKKLIRSIQEKLLPFKDDTLVFPGHGPKTTIGFERRENPFVTGRW